MENHPKIARTVNCACGTIERIHPISFHCCDASAMYSKYRFMINDRLKKRITERGLSHHFSIYYYYYRPIQNDEENHFKS